MLLWSKPSTLHLQRVLLISVSVWENVPSSLVSQWRKIMVQSQWRSIFFFPVSSLWYKHFLIILHWKHWKSYSSLTQTYFSDTTPLFSSLLNLLVWNMCSNPSDLFITCRSSSLNTPILIKHMLRLDTTRGFVSRITRNSKTFFLTKWWWIPEAWAAAKNDFDPHF